MLDGKKRGRECGSATLQTDERDFEAAFAVLATLHFYL